MRVGRSGDLRLWTGGNLCLPGILIAAYRHLVINNSLISVLDGTAKNWCEQEHLRAQIKEHGVLRDNQRP